MAPVPLGFDPMFAATCLGWGLAPAGLFAVVGAMAVAAVVFLAVLPVAFRSGRSRKIDEQPARLVSPVV